MDENWTKQTYRKTDFKYAKEQVCILVIASRQKENLFESEMLLFLLQTSHGEYVPIKWFVLTANIFYFALSERSSFQYFFMGNLLGWICAGSLKEQTHTILLSSTSTKDRTVTLPIEVAVCQKDFCFIFNVETRKERHRHELY